jgi:hypothetical protein
MTSVIGNNTSPGRHLHNSSIRKRDGDFGHPEKGKTLESFNRSIMDCSEAKWLIYLIRMKKL